jgi:hypothetical protein
MIAYNVEAAKVDIEVVKGDTLKMFFAVNLNGSAYPDLVGAQIDMTVRKIDGTEIAAYSSAGTSPAITISSGVYCLQAAAFGQSGNFKYDVQITDDGEVMTFQIGNFTVLKEQTS